MTDIRYKLKRHRPSPARKEGNRYDTTLKEIFQDSEPELLRFFVQQEAIPIGSMEIEFPRTQNPRVDKLTVIQSSRGQTVCHIEFQSANDPSMPYRMLEYATKICSSKANRDNKPPFQLVIYVGRDPLTMDNQISYDLGPQNHLAFRYQLLDIGAIDPEEIIATGNPKLYSLLPVTGRRQRRKDPIPHLKKCLQAIIESPMELVSKRHVLLQSEILAGMAYDEALIELLYREVETMMKLEESAGYRRIIKKGVEIGRMEGKAEGKIEGKIEGLSEGMFKMLTRQLQVKLGPLSPDIQEKLKKQDPEVLENIAEHIFEIASLDDLNKYMH